MKTGLASGLPELGGGDAASFSPRPVPGLRVVGDLVVGERPGCGELRCIVSLSLLQPNPNTVITFPSQWCLLRAELLCVSW